LAHIVEKDKDGDAKQNRDTNPSGNYCATATGYGVTDKGSYKAVPTTRFCSQLIEEISWNELRKIGPQ
jgi:hypothetical protein